MRTLLEIVPLVQGNLIRDEFNQGHALPNLRAVQTDVAVITMQHNTIFACGVFVSM